jgi:nucleotide-binding universal stress UspA family protein
MTSEIRRIRFEKILYATDFSPASEVALPYALAVAEHYGATVFVVHAITPELYVYCPPESVESVLYAAEQYANECMGKLTSSAMFGDIPHSGVVRHGEIWDVLSAMVSEHSIDLIVVGTRGRRGLSKLILGSAAEEVFRLSNRPVLTVGPHGTDTPPKREMQSILFATDFSADSARAMNYAISLAEEFQARLIVMHVAPAPETDPCVKVRLTDFFTERLNEFVPTEALSWCNPEYVVEFGPPAESILRTATERQAELIVLGVRGTGSMIRTSTHFGATAHRVVADACCPVLTIRG